MTDYSNDAPEIRDDTNAQELIDYAKRRIENPIEINGTVIYHFNSHEPDMDALERAVNEKLRRDKYTVPLQVQSGWTLLVEILPEDIKKSELLIYREDQREYYGYNNMIRELPIEKRQKIRQELSELIT